MLKPIGLTGFYGQIWTKPVWWFCRWTEWRLLDLTTRLRRNQHYGCL